MQVKKAETTKMSTHTYRSIQNRGSKNSESYAGHLDRQAQISTGPE